MLRYLPYFLVAAAFIGLFAWMLGGKDAWDDFQQAQARKTTPSATKDREQRRFDAINTRVATVSDEGLRADLPAEWLNVLRNRIIRESPGLTAEQVTARVNYHLRRRFRAMLTFFDACAYGSSTLIGSPELTADQVTQMAAEWERQYGYPCRYLNE